MKKINITDKDRWKEFIIKEAYYELPKDCLGGICVDAGCNIGDFPLNHKDRFDTYICYDVFKENIEECIKNTKSLSESINIEINHLALWSESNELIDVMAYEPWDTKDINHFGNSGNVGCVKWEGEKGEGWNEDNIIEKIKTISIDSIIEKYGVINLLKIDVEGSEYEFLMGKDLSKINYIVGESHGSIENQEILAQWISKTHNRLSTNPTTLLFKKKGL
jgi:FkbM family methyltransferase|tara:strand:- start:4816 stop:5475 length:660 start_codon:yes stop_codon:yes gene_type:complete